MGLSTPNRRSALESSVLLKEKMQEQFVGEKITKQGPRAFPSRSC